jgi:hypothetical protein
MARLKSCPDTKQMAATLHGQALAAPSGNRKKSNLDRFDSQPSLRDSTP